jgi:hypothetical protein
MSGVSLIGLKQIESTEKDASLKSDFSNEAQEQVRRALQPGSSYFDQNLKPEEVTRKKITLPVNQGPKNTIENISIASRSIIDELRNNLITKPAGQYANEAVSAVMSNLSEDEKKALNSCMVNRAEGKPATEADQKILLSLKIRSENVLNGAAVEVSRGYSDQQKNSLANEIRELDASRTLGDKLKSLGIITDAPTVGPLQQQHDVNMQKAIEKSVLTILDKEASDKETKRILSLQVPF